MKRRHAPRLRSVLLGEHINLPFESALTIGYQIQKVLRNWKAPS